MIFTIKVNYKSGISHTFDVTSFKIESGIYSCAHADGGNKPLSLGAGEIESVWQVGFKEQDDA